GVRDRRRQRERRGTVFLRDSEGEVDDMVTDTGLLMRASDISRGNFASGDLTGGGVLSTLVLGGESLSLIVADRDPGYHSAPHRHAAEQLNYVAKGEIWIFVETEGFRAREGDFFRIPKDAVHWSWVRGDEPCRLIEAHAPSVAADAMWSES